jgi:translation initiation factor IF-2
VNRRLLQLRGAEVTSEAEPKSDEKVIHIKPPHHRQRTGDANGAQAISVISDLIGDNIFAAINQPIEADCATKVCVKHGFTFEKEKREKGRRVT